MSCVPKKVASRILSNLPKFQKVIQLAKDRDLNESDTVSILNDILADIFGYDKYLEVTSELMIRGTFCDLAIKVDEKIQFIIEAKAIGLDLKESHIKQAIDYGANYGIPWVILTNGLDWRLYRIRFEQPINFDLVCSFSFLSLNAKSEKDQELLYILCKEGLCKNAREDYFEVVQNVNRYVIGHLLLSEAIIGSVRKELKKLADGIRVDDSEIEQILRHEIIKREILEGESSSRAFQKINKLYKKQTKAKKANEQASLVKESVPVSSGESMSEQLLRETNEQN